MGKLIDIENAKIKKLSVLKDVIVRQEYAIQEIQEMLNERSNLIERAWDFEDDLDMAVTVLKAVAQVIEKMPKNIVSQYFDQELIEEIEFYKE